MDCTTLECTVPGIYDFDLQASVVLLMSYDGWAIADIPLTTELYETILL